MFSCFIILLYIFLMMLIKFFCRKNYLHKKVLFVYVSWAFLIIFISNLNPFHLYDVNNKIYLIWILNVIITVISSIIFISKKNVDETKFNFDINKVIKSKIFILANIVLFFSLCYFLSKYNMLAQSSSIYDLRMIRYTTLFNSGYESYIFNYIIIVVLRIDMLILAIALINKKYKNLTFLLGIANLIIYTMIGYGRMAIFEFCLYSLFVLLIYKKNFSLKKIFNIVLSFMFVFVIMSIITTIRVVGLNNVNYSNFIDFGVSNLSRQIIVYFIGGFRTLSIYIDSSNFMNYRFIRMTFAGFEDLLSLVTGFLHIGFSPINTVLGAYTQKPVIIGYDNTTFNAFYTAIFNFYGDLGILGVCIYSFMSGILLSFSISIFSKKNNFVSLLIYMYVGSMLLCSIYRWNYQIGNYLIVLLLLLIIYLIRRKKKNEFNEENN